MQTSPRFVSSGQDRLRHLLHAQQIGAARSGLRSVVRSEVFSYPFVCFFSVWFAFGNMSTRSTFSRYPDVRSLVIHTECTLFVSTFLYLRTHPMRAFFSEIARVGFGVSSIRHSTRSQRTLSMLHSQPHTTMFVYIVTLRCVNY